MSMADDDDKAAVALARDFERSRGGDCGTVNWPAPNELFACAVVESEECEPAAGARNKFLARDFERSRGGDCGTVDWPVPNELFACAVVESEECEPAAGAGNKSLARDFERSRGGDCGTENCMAANSGDIESEAKAISRPDETMSSSITVSAISISDEGERDCPGDTTDGEKLEVVISAVVGEAALCGTVILLGEDLA
jgi:hypothetical protein